MFLVVLQAHGMGDDLKLYAEKAWSFAKEGGLGLEVVVLDGIEPMGAAKTAEAVGAAGGLALPVLVVSVVHMEELSAIGAVGVVALIAALTKGRAVAAGVFASPDALAAMGAEGGFLLQTAGAKVLFVEAGASGNGHFLAADFAGKDFCGHDATSLKLSKLL